MNYRSSSQVTFAHRDPEVLTASVNGLLAELKDLPHAAAGPTFIREAAVLEIYTQSGKPEVIDRFHEFLDVLAEEQPAVSSVLSVMTEEANL